MKSPFRFILVAVLALLALPVLAQSAATINALTPMTRDLGAIKTLTAATAATYTSADQTGYNVSRIACVFNESTSVGSPTVVFTIQNKDYVSSTYYDLVSSATLQTVTSMPVALYAGAGVDTVANVGAGKPIARYWRVKAVVAGSTSVTGTIGCSVQ